MKDENEQVYEELLLGKPKDPTKDPRWHAVKGLKYALNITIGACPKGKNCSLAKAIGKQLSDLLDAINKDKKKKNGT